MSYYRTTKLAISPEVSSEIQLIQNEEFLNSHTIDSSWVSSTGWGGNANPTIAGGSLNFTYTSRTVTQVVDLLNYSNFTEAAVEYEVARSVHKTDAQSIYNIDLVFRNASNQQVWNYRIPVSGNSNTAGSNWVKREYDFNLQSSQDVTNLYVAITARETANWAGQYGPKFNYFKVFLR